MSNTTSSTLKYRSRENAKAVVYTNRKLALVLGDDGLHWVVTMAAAARMERQGYTVEYLPR
jgi:hypothetical protein